MMVGMSLRRLGSPHVLNENPFLECERPWGRDKRRTVKDILSQENPDIVIILETKRYRYNREFVKGIWGKKKGGVGRH